MSLVYVYNPQSGAYTEFTKQGKCDLIRQEGEGLAQDFALAALDFRPEGADLCQKLSDLTGIDFSLGPNKKVERATEKSWGLSGATVVDYVRGMGKVKKPADVTKVLKFLDPASHVSPVTVGPYRLEALENNFETPKDGGLRCLHMVFRLEKPNGRSFLMELQARVSGMEEREERTHGIHKTARECMAKPRFYVGDPESMTSLEKKLTKFATECDEIRMDIHNKGYRDLGFDVLLKDQIPNEKPRRVTDAYRVLSRNPALQALMQKHDA